jgi:predicted phosphodiesterase
MRTLILSDIHSNLTALEAVLGQAQGKYDQVICLGDIVGYGPDPNEVIERVRALQPAAVVRGNHDKACCGISDAQDFNAVARTAATWTREQLPAENLSYLRQLDTGPLAVAGFQIVHGSIRDEDEYVFTPRDAHENLELAQVPLTFCGHTHFQGGFALRDTGRLEVLRVRIEPGVGFAEYPIAPGAKYLINPGSIGQPRDGDPRAGFAFYDHEKPLVEYWRVPYDIEATQKRMKTAKLPEPLIARLSVGR